MRNFNGFCSLVRLRAPYREWERIRTFPFGTIVYDLDLSPDGTRLSLSQGEISGRQTLRLFPVGSLVSGDSTSRMLYNFGSSIPSSFVFSPDGRYLFGSSYYTGVSNVFRYDLNADSMDVVTNAETALYWDKSSNPYRFSLQPIPDTLGVHVVSMKAIYEMLGLWNAEEREEHEEQGEQGDKSLAAQVAEMQKTIDLLAKTIHQPAHEPRVVSFAQYFFFVHPSYLVLAADCADHTDSSE